MENATFELDIVGCAGFTFAKRNNRQMAVPVKGREHETILRGHVIFSN